MSSLRTLYVKTHEKHAAGAVCQTPNDNCDACTKAREAVDNTLHRLGSHRPSDGK